MGTSGDHADAIQFWTASTTASASNIVISNNIYVRGSGEPVDGIFMTDGAGHPYNNVTVTGNTIIGCEYWGIEANSINGLNISSNLVKAYADMPNWIGIQNATNVIFRDNTASSYLMADNQIGSRYSNQIIGSVNPVASTLNLQIPVTVVAPTGAVAERLSVVGDALTGDQGVSIYLADVGVGAGHQVAVGAGGATLKGAYGTLTVNSNGFYSYIETDHLPTAGQTYDDHFTTTVASPSGSVKSSTLDIIVTGSARGDGGADIIYGGAGPETISGFGAASHLYSGTGPDTFVFGDAIDSQPSAQTVIQGFKPGDLIDLSAVDPLFHFVSRFDGQADEVVIGRDSAGTGWQIYGDTTGSGTANFQLHLTNSTVANLSAANFHI